MLATKKSQIAKHKYQTNPNDRNSKFQTIGFWSYLRFGYCTFEFICNLMLVICYFRFIRLRPLQFCFWHWQLPHKSLEHYSNENNHDLRKFDCLKKKDTSASSPSITRRSMPGIGVWWQISKRRYYSGLGWNTAVAAYCREIQGLCGRVQRLSGEAGTGV